MAPPLEERELVEGLKAGSAQALDDYALRTHHPLFLMAGRLTRDPDRRRDWAHDVLLGILDDVRTGRFEYRGPGSFWGWFRKRAYFRLLDLERNRRRREQRERVADDATGDPLESFCGGEDPAAEMERTEFLSAFESCLGRLPNPLHREALARRVLEDQSYDDIANAMTAALNTVRAWIRRARLVVRDCIAERLGWTAPGDRHA
jgi:RNA polymerase sigma-70 factor (ECF subfamily)